MKDYNTHKWRAFDNRIIKYVSPKFINPKDLWKYLESKFKKDYIEKWIAITF